MESKRPSANAPSGHRPQKRTAGGAAAAAAAGDRAVPTERARHPALQAGGRAAQAGMPSGPTPGVEPAQTRLGRPGERSNGPHPHPPPTRPPDHQPGPARPGPACPHLLSRCWSGVCGGLERDSRPPCERGSVCVEGRGCEGAGVRLQRDAAAPGPIRAIGSGGRVLMLWRRRGLSFIGPVKGSTTLGAKVQQVAVGVYAACPSPPGSASALQTVCRSASVTAGQARLPSGRSDLFKYGLALS
jgi:hypothetical protein